MPKNSNPLKPKLCEVERDGNWLPPAKEEFCAPFEACELDALLLALPPPPFVPAAPEYAKAELGLMDWYDAKAPAALAVPWPPPPPPPPPPLDRPPPDEPRSLDEPPNELAEFCAPPALGSVAAVPLTADAMRWLPAATLSAVEDTEPPPPPLLPEVDVAPPRLPPPRNSRSPPGLSPPRMPRKRPSSRRPSSPPNWNGLTDA